MGDNRDNSQDSRYWGMLPRERRQGPGADDLLVVRIGTEDYLQTGSAPTVKDLVHGRHPLLHPDALVADVPPHPLES